MNSVMEQLWSGNIAPAENWGVGNSEIEKLVVWMERHKTELDKELGQLHRLIFEKFVDCTDEYVYLLSKSAFFDGFSPGVKRMAEIVSGVSTSKP